MNVIVGSANHKEEGVMTIPLPIPRKEYDHSIGMLQELGIGDVFKEDCLVIDIENGLPILQRLKGMSVNIDELDYLAKRLESFDERELAAFQGMAEAHDLKTPKDLINLTFCCENVTVVQDFRNLEQIGRLHYMNLNGGCASQHELKSLNAKETAIELLNSKDGKITSYGIIYENGAELIERYDGNAFPMYSYENELLFVEISKEGSTHSTWLFLPMSDSQIERTMIRSGFYAEGNIRIEFIESELPLEIIDKVFIPNESIYELNRMCAAISDLPEKDIDKLTAAVIMAKPESALQITNLAKNLEQFDFVPNARTPEDYGKHIIRESGHFEYDMELDDFYDYAKYGNYRMETETGEFNACGYISYHGILSLDELMLEDPAEAYQQEQGFQIGGM